MTHIAGISSKAADLVTFLLVFYYYYYQTIFISFFVASWPCSIASPHAGNTATATSTTAAAATSSTSTTSTTAPATTSVFFAWSAGYPTTAAVQHATYVACFIGPCTDEPSFANAANISTPVPAEHDEQTKVDSGCEAEATAAAATTATKSPEFQRGTNQETTKANLK